MKIGLMMNKSVAHWPIMSKFVLWSQKPRKSTSG